MEKREVFIIKGSKLGHSNGSKGDRKICQDKIVKSTYKYGHTCVVEP